VCLVNCGCACKVQCGGVFRWEEVFLGGGGYFRFLITKVRVKTLNTVRYGKIKTSFPFCSFVAL